MAFVDQKDLKHTAITLGVIGAMVAPAFFYDQGPAAPIPHLRENSGNSNEVNIATANLTFSPRERLLAQLQDPRFIRTLEDMHDITGEDPRFFVCSQPGRFIVRNTVQKREAPTKISRDIEELKPGPEELPAHVIVKIERYIENPSGINTWFGNIDKGGRLSYIAQEQAYRTYLVNVKNAQNCEEIPLPGYLGFPQLAK